MKLVIFGSRGIYGLPVLERCIKNSHIDMSTVTEIVSGGAGGVDTLAIQYAEVRDLPCKVFYADWDKYGRSAGYLRNIQMSKYADYGLALWDGESRGTKHMIGLMTNRCEIFTVKKLHFSK